VRTRRGGTRGALQLASDARICTNGTRRCQTHREPDSQHAEPGAAAPGNELSLFTAGLIRRWISIRLIDDNAVMSADSYADLLERLLAAYETRHSLATIEDVVAQCRTDLTGQTPPGARFGVARTTCTATP
jgi:hypothetical protein